MIDRNILLAALAGLSMAAFPAEARDTRTISAAEPPSAIVSYRDLDLSSASGRAALQARVRSAATRLCMDYGVRDLGREMAQSRCFEAALADGERQIGVAIAQSGTQRLAGRGTIKVLGR